MFLIPQRRKGLAPLYGRTGREELTTAMDMYCEMAMTFFLDKAEAAMAGVG